jgi:hypothetical protein
MTRMQDKIVDGFLSLSCYYLGVMDTEQTINNLVLHLCHVITLA